jgi:hypothetical protein
VSFDLSRTTGATHGKIYVTEPTGKELPPITCSSSPCEIQIPDREAGRHLVRIDYWSDTELLSSGHPAPVEIPAR